MYCKRVHMSNSLVSLAAGKVHKTVQFAGGTAKNAKSAKRIVWSETSLLLSNSSGLRFIPFAFLASLAVQYHFLRRYEVARYALAAVSSSGMAFLFCVSHILKFCNEGFSLRAKLGLRTPQKYSSKSRLN